MLETKSKTIGTYTYNVTQMGATEGRKALLRLDKLSSQDEETFEYFCNTFAKNTTVTLGDGKQPRLSDIFDIHFAGRYDDVLEWITFCVEVNFGSFLDKQRSKASAA